MQIQQLDWSQRLAQMKNVRLRKKTEVCDYLLKKKEVGQNVIIVGDCKKVGNLRTVIWGAWDVAMKLQFNRLKV